MFVPVGRIGRILASNASSVKGPHRMSIRLAVTSDLHLGAANSPGIRWLVDTALRHAEGGARALVIAGDLVHRDVEVSHVVPPLVDALGAVAERLPVLFIYGNHDAAVRLADALPPIDGAVAVDSLTPVEVRLPGVELIFHCVSVASDPDRRAIAETFPVAPHPAGHVGVFHTSLHGGFHRVTCLPASVDQLASRNYDAWILGHIHRARAVSERPPIFWPGQGQMRALHVAPLPPEPPEFPEHSPGIHQASTCRQ